MVIMWFKSAEIDEDTGLYKTPIYIDLDLIDLELNKRLIMKLNHMSKRNKSNRIYRLEDGQIKYRALNKISTPPPPKSVPRCRGNPPGCRCHNDSDCYYVCINGNCYQQIYMEKLSLTFNKYGTTLNQLKRTKNVALYEQTFERKVIAYVVVIIKVKPGDPDVGTKPREKFPEKSKWGKLGWTHMTRLSAEKKFDQIITQLG